MNVKIVDRRGRTIVQGRGSSPASTDSVSRSVNYLRANRAKFHGNLGWLNDRELPVIIHPSPIV